MDFVLRSTVYAKPFGRVKYVQVAKSTRKDIAKRRDAVEHSLDVVVTLNARCSWWLQNSKVDMLQGAVDILMQ